MNTINTQAQPTDLTPLRPLSSSDEIDLRLLILNLVGEWKLITAITCIAMVAAVGYALTRPSIFKIESTLAAPTAGDLANMPEQNLVSISPRIALDKLVDLIISPRVQSDIFAKSNLYALMKEGSELSAAQLFLSFRENLSVERFDHEFFMTADETADDAKKEVKLSFESAYPKEANQFLNDLIDHVMQQTVVDFQNNVKRVQSEKLNSLDQQLDALTKAEKSLREAQIARIEEENVKKINTLELELSLLETKAREDRLLQIQRLKEALKTAQELNVIEPVRWLSESANGDSALTPMTLNWIKDNYPTYYRGTKHLSAEIAMLENRENDLLYVGKATEIKRQISQVKSDPALAALKDRANDAIHVPQYNELISKRQLIQSQPLNFPNAVVATIVQPPILPTIPVSPNRKLIVLSGAILGAFLALFIALIKIALRPTDEMNTPFSGAR